MKLYNFYIKSPVGTISIIAREKTEDYEPNNPDAIKELVTDWKIYRRYAYEERIDPKIQDALLDNFLGKPEKLQALLVEYNKIKQEFPKPTGLNDPGEKEWL